MTGCLSGSYDPYPALILQVWIGVNDKEKGDRADHPDSVPSLIPVLDAIRENNVQRIVPNVLGDSKSQAVLGEVRSRLLSIPFKFHHAPAFTLLYEQNICAYVRTITYFVKDRLRAFPYVDGHERPLAHTRPGG
jgi:hypothetical protein